MCVTKRWGSNCNGLSVVVNSSDMKCNNNFTSSNYNSGSFSAI
jgi:hypothetical protein